MSRFTGMTYDVAEFLANRVFCILNDDPHSAPPQRVDAHEFGMWVKNLPALLGDDCQTALSSRAPSLAPVPRPAHQMQSHSRQASATMSTFAERHWDLETERLDKQLASLVRQDSQHSSISQTAVARPRLRPISTSIQFSDFDSTVPATDAQPGLELEGEGDDDCLSPQTPGPELCSRSTSTNKRRKRGTRRGKAAHQQGGSANGVMSPITPSATPLSEYGGTFALGGVSSYASQDNLRDDARLANLAEGAQILARELSKKKLGATTPTPRSDHFSAIPTPPMPLVPALFASALQPAQLPPTPFFPPPSSNRTTSPPATQRLTKKPSKWNVFVRKETESPASNPLPGSASSLSLSSAVSGTAKPALSVRSNGSTERSTSASRGMSATAASVTTILMGLDAPPRSNNASRERSRSVARSTEREQEKKQILTYSSGNASSSSVGSSSLSWARGRRIEPHDLNWGPSSPPENAFGATVSNRRIPPVPLLPPSVVEQRDRWSNPTADRSPSSLRSARTSYAPSLESPNWRQSSQSAQSSTQSHGPGQQSQSSSSASSIAGASGFTRFSNASVRSVSTVATSISAGSALRYSMSKSSFVSTDEDHSFTPSVPVPTPREARRISPMVKSAYSLLLLYCIETYLGLLRYGWHTMGVGQLRPALPRIATQ